MARRYPSIEQAVEAVPRESRILVAVSGGRDSVSLLHALKASPFQRTLQVAHVDHGLREASAKDAEFVRRLASEYGIPVHLTRLSPPVLGNLEDWARAARYAFFREILEREKLDFIVTAHHANDEVETYFMRLLANKEPRLLRESDHERSLLRPFLRVSRETIDSYVKTKALSFVEDATNADAKLLRNRVRHRLLPLIAAEFPDFRVESLAERLRVLQADFELLDEWSAGILAPLELCSFADRHWLQTFVQILDSYPNALRWRLVEAAFLKEIGFRLGYEKSCRVGEFLHGNARELQLEGMRLLRADGGLVLDQTRVRKLGGG